MWILILLHAIFASTYSFGKLGLDYAQPVFLIATRMITSAFFLFALLAIWRSSFTIKKGDYHLFFSLAFFQIYLSYVPEFTLLQYMSTTKWALIYTLTPFVTALFSYFHGKEQLTRLKMLGLTIGFIGIVPAIVFNPQDLKEIMYISLPDLVFTLCMISYSYGWTIARTLIKERHYNPLFINGVAMFWGGMGALITSPFADQWTPSPVLSWGPFLAILAALVLASTAAFVLNTYLLHYYTATFLLFLMFVDPLYTTLYGWLFLHEPIVPSFFVSAFLVFIGLYLFYREELKHPYVV